MYVGKSLPEEKYSKKTKEDRVPIYERELSNLEPMGINFFTREYKQVKKFCIRPEFCRPYTHGGHG